MDMKVFVSSSAGGSKNDVQELRRAFVQKDGCQLVTRMNQTVTHVVAGESYRPTKSWPQAQLLTSEQAWNLINSANSAANETFGSEIAPPTTAKRRRKWEEQEQEKPKAPEQKLQKEVQKEKENIVKEVRKGKCAVDRYCPVVTTTHVYQESKLVWDAMLNQTNICRNNNKFYLIQLLESDEDDCRLFYVWRRWGRVGVVGQSDLSSCGSDLPAAKASFCRKFHDKTRNEWGSGEKFEPYPGKYTLLERDYGKDDFDLEQQQKSTSLTNAETKSKLDPRLQSLISLIFDVSMMSRSLVEIGYDANKMPLGKLSKAHVNKGYEILTMIAKVLDHSSSSSNTGRSRQKPQRPASAQKGLLEELTSKFYTLIPHSFGMSRPPLIDSKVKLKEKLQLVESLADIEIATNLIRHLEESDQHIIDRYYLSLGIQISALQRHSHAWGIIETYATKTHAPTHSEYKLQILDIYELYRPEEEEMFLDVSNSVLLWHGSRLMNFVGILSRGLRIAPPEAPSTGYMFGKGVYFADMVSKSANYCDASKNSPEGLLLLCQVSLGRPVELMESDYYADRAVKRGKGHSVKGCGGTVPNESEYTRINNDVLVPCGSPKPSGISGGSLLYNEYIVYNTQQIKMKYIVRVRFDFQS